MFVQVVNRSQCPVVARWAGACGGSGAWWYTSGSTVCGALWECASWARTMPATKRYTVVDPTSRGQSAQGGWSRCRARSTAASSRKGSTGMRWVVYPPQPKNGDRFIFSPWPRIKSAHGSAPGGAFPRSATGGTGSFRSRWTVPTGRNNRRGFEGSGVKP